MYKHTFVLWRAKRGAGYLGETKKISYSRTGHGGGVLLLYACMSLSTLNILGTAVQPSNPRFEIRHERSDFKNAPYVLHTKGSKSRTLVHPFLFWHDSNSEI